jgi:ubiquinone/menaquinone biosynthesis C-methylase UbiE
MKPNSEVEEALLQSLRCPIMRHDYTSITELPTTLLTPDQMRRFAHRYGYAQTLARGQRVLEVACGAGGGLNYLAENAAWVVGLDYTGGVLLHARQNSRAPLAQSDAQRLPFASEQFDLVLCFEAIYYLEEYRRFLAESHRVLTTGGKTLICQSNPDWPNFVPGALTTHYPRLPELVAGLTQAGFRDVKCYGTLPITATNARQKVVNALRQWAIKSGILSRLGPLRSLLQRMSYGQLYPLPSAIDAQWVATWQADLSQTPLSPTQPDRVHRVIYVEGTR